MSEKLELVEYLCELHERTVFKKGHGLIIRLIKDEIIVFNKNFITQIAH